VQALRTLRISERVHSRPAIGRCFAGNGVMLRARICGAALCAVDAAWGTYPARCPARCRDISDPRPSGLVGRSGPYVRMSGAYRSPPPLRAPLHSVFINNGCMSLEGGRERGGGQMRRWTHDPRPSGL
jgi:hypothetical protein